MSTTAPTATFVHFEHEDCMGPWDEAFHPEDRARFDYVRGWLTGEPWWICRACGDRFTYVECACHVAHECVPS